jgi:hypothetical protein
MLKLINKNKQIMFKEEYNQKREKLKEKWSAELMALTDEYLEDLGLPKSGSDEFYQLIHNIVCGQHGWGDRIFTITISGGDKTIDTLYNAPFYCRATNWRNYVLKNGKTYNFYCETDKDDDYNLVYIEEDCEETKRKNALFTDIINFNQPLVRSLCNKEEFNSNNFAPL